MGVKCSAQRFAREGVSMRKRFFLGFGLFIFMFGVSDAASANNIKITLTAKVQEDVTVPSAGVMQYTAITLRITQKDLLTLLSYAGYTLPAKPVLAYHIGSFQILDGNGTLVHSVSSTHLAIDLSIGPSVDHGISDQNPGGADKYTDVRAGTFALNADSGNYFSLDGIFESKTSDNGMGTIAILRSATCLGTGELGNAPAMITGKIKYKLP